MSFNLPAAIQAFWAAQGGLPSLWLEYAPEPLNPPLAVLESSGYSRDYISAGMKAETFKFQISILSASAVTTWSFGEAAIQALDQFTHDKITTVRVSPDNLAKPVQVGQVDLWVFEISLEIEVFDN